jgi:hypothetical protein
VNDHDIGIGYPLKRLQAETRLSSPLLDHPHKPGSSWHAVDALGITGAGIST